MKIWIAAALLLFVGCTYPLSRAATASESGLQVIYTFSLEAYEPKMPTGNLIEGDDGELYGTTRGGGPHESDGTLFKLSKDGHLTVIQYFPWTNSPSTPTGQLVRGLDGSIYGTTQGGVYGNGTIYRVSSNGTVSTVYSFRYDTNGSSPHGITQTPDGNFYGVTTSGGTFNRGTIFKYSTNGTFNCLWSFDNTNGGYPRGQLLLAGDGNLYGTTLGYLPSIGTVFRCSTDGRVTTLVAFDNTNGARPDCDLVLGEEGEMYGSTTSGGQFGLGTLFKITTNGALTTLFHFDGTNGKLPNGSLMRSRQGYLYGLTASTGPGLSLSNYGNIFRLAPNGDFKILVRFDGTNGTRPVGKIIQSRDGSIYAALSDIMLKSEANGNTVVRLEEQPTIASIVAQNNEATITWGSISNRFYQLEDQSAGLPWNAASAPIFAQGDRTSFTVPSTREQCHYRVVLLP